MLFFSKFITVGNRQGPAIFIKEEHIQMLQSKRSPLCKAKVTP